MEEIKPADETGKSESTFDADLITDNKIVTKKSKKLELTKPLIIKVLVVVLVIIVIAIVILSFTNKKNENENQESESQEEEMVEEESEDEQAIEEEKCEPGVTDIRDYQSENFSNITFKYDHCKWDVLEDSEIKSNPSDIQGTLSAEIRVVNNDKSLIIKILEIPYRGSGLSNLCFKEQAKINIISNTYTRIKTFDNPNITSFFEDYKTKEKYSYRYFKKLIFPEDAYFRDSVESYLLNFNDFGIVSYPLSYIESNYNVLGQGYRFCLPTISDIYTTKSDRTYASLGITDSSVKPTDLITAYVGITYTGNDEGIELADEIIKTLDMGE